MSRRDEMYESVLRDFGRALDRVAGGYEADAEKRRDLRQEIHLQVWKSLDGFDGRCSLKTWVFRVAHNAGVSYVNRERRARQRWVTLEQVEAGVAGEPDIDRERAREQLASLVRSLAPLDRQVMIGYLEGLDTASIAAITGLTAAHTGMKIHRIKKVLMRGFAGEKHHG